MTSAVTSEVTSALTSEVTSVVPLLLAFEDTAEDTRVTAAGSFPAQKEDMVDMSLCPVDDVSVVDMSLCAPDVLSVGRSVVEMSPCPADVLSADRSVVEMYLCPPDVLSVDRSAMDMSPCPANVLSVDRSVLDISMCPGVVLSSLSSETCPPDVLSLVRSVEVTGGLEGTIWLLCRADSSVTAESVSDLLVRGRLMSLSPLSVTVLCTCEDVTCLLSLCISSVLSGLLMVETLLDSPTGLCVDE